MLIKIIRDKRFSTPTDISEITGASKSYDYSLIKHLNNELEKKGFLVIPGKVISTYFYERFFGKEVDKDASIQR